LKEAFKLNWIKNEKDFCQMLEDKNITSHIYKEEKSVEIFDRICNIYISNIKELLKKLKIIAKE